MIKNYLQFINENHYLDLSESIKTLNDICYDLKDEGITYQIHPDNEIKVKMLSLSLSGKIYAAHIEDFYLNIDTVNRKLTDQVGMFSAPEWFVDVLNRIEDYMSGIGFNVSYTAIYYSGDKEHLDDVSGISDITGLIKAIRLDLKKINLNESKLYHARLGGKKRWSVKYKKSINCNNPKGFSQNH